MKNPILFLALIPLLWRVIVALVPAHYLEPYAYWDGKTLNTPGEEGTPGWRNMGYWDGTDDFTAANEALARKLLAFADARNGHVLDIAHGTGESLLIHLENAPERLDALTSLNAESAHAQALVANYTAAHDVKTPIKWWVSSASYRPNKDIHHPLNPMRGFLGQDTAGGESDGESDYVDVEAELESDSDSAQVVFGDDSDSPSDTDRPRAPPASTVADPYDLVYILDAIYHFPPSVAHFAGSVLPVLREGSGVLAYTDVVPPSWYSSFPVQIAVQFLEPLLAVPKRNLIGRPADLDAYKAMLENVGYDDVSIEDWTAHVFDGLANNLDKRGGMWSFAAMAVRGAQRQGWKFIAVRGVRRPGAASVGTPPNEETDE